MNRKSILSKLALLMTAFVLLTASTNPLYGQGKLNRVRKAVRNDKPAKSSRDDSRDKESARDKRKSDRQDREPRRSSNRSRNKSGSSGFGFLISHLLTPSVQEVHVVHHVPTTVSAPIVIAQPEPVYQPVVAPVVQQASRENDYFVQSEPAFDWGIRFTAVGGTDFDGIALGNFGLLLQVPNWLGIDSSVTMFHESGSDFRDHLYLGDLNVVYEPVCTNMFRMRFGVGINWLGDAYGGDAGFNMTCGFDLKLIERWIATGEVDFGSIGDTELTHAQISLGRVISANTEWTVGYDHRDIGGVTIGSAFTGLRFRF